MWVRTKNFTILHSNDMHGDFLAEMRGEAGNLIGGLGLLSGYLNRVRQEEDNVLYCISGDMVQGSIIDSEYKGISTIEIMNYLAPDVATLGNHEFDYGLPHMLFLEKMANFPIVNANLYIARYNKRLMRPHVVVRKAGLDILFIGIITKSVIDSIQQNKELSSFITLQEASAEVGKICNAYKNDDIDLTILLTHIGFDADKELAALLRPEWGVDMIIGGHSHTVLEQPALVNGVLIAQAGTGTDQIGRFDVTVDDDTNSIVEWKWQLVPISSSTAEPDRGLEEYINSFKTEVDRKYNTIICKLVQQLTHPERTQETSLGNLVADAFAQVTGVDVAIVGSGSIRGKSLGPLVTLGDMISCFPYDDTVTRFTVSGADLKTMFAHFMRPENRNGEGEYYQVSSGVRAVYNLKEHRLESLSYQGRPVGDDDKLTICLQGYHCSIADKAFNVPRERLGRLAPPRVVATSAREVLEEYLRNHQNLNAAVEGRLEYI
jgi:5'-nucleotidase